MTTLRRTLVATAPTRLDFGGGWTDVPPYPEERGGFVCNLAIERRATVRMHTASDNHGAAPEPVDRLVRAALSKASLSGATVHLTSDFPVGAGLGGSSAAGVALAAALHALRNQPATPAQLAEWSRAVEVEELQLAGGFQDHYAAAYGGALALTFGAETHVEQISMSEQLIADLEKHILLFYTGESRISANTITAVLEAYRTRVPGVVHALARMSALARDMHTALTRADIETLAALVDEHWVYQRSLHAAISTERIDIIEQTARAAGATALKALGASSGGCVMIFAPAHATEQVAHAVQPYAERLTWQVARTGVAVHSDA
jgi:D-glycero-alpha-D-manno-heptose-7-phosphate kinase